MLTRLPSMLLGGLLSLAATFSLSAQCGDSNFGPVLGTGDDTTLPIQSLGFAFPFAGSTYTDVYISTNGLLYLTNGPLAVIPSPACCNGDPTLLTSSTSPIIAPYWMDLYAYPGTGAVHYNVLPGKVVITWNNVYEFYQQGLRTIQCQLDVAGNVTFSYDNRTAIASHVALVGMSEGNGAVLPAASDFLTGLITSTNTNYELFDTTTNLWDLGGLTVQLFPTSPGWVWVVNNCPSASNTNYGTGCYTIAGNDSAYQLFTTGAATWSPALQGNAITFVPTGSSYLIASGGTYVPPTGAATVLGLGDDTIVNTPTLTTPFPYPGGVATSFQVCSNGHVAVGSGNSTAWVPSAATMLGNASTAWYSWTDYNPTIAGSGQVKFEQAGGIVYVTWDGVIHYGATTLADADTMQFQFNTATGNVTIVWQTMTTTNPTTSTNYLVGYSPGGASPDPGSIDLATALPYLISNTSVQAMTLSADVSPISTGTSGSTVHYTLGNVPELVPTSGIHVGLQIFSFSQVPAPGLDLTFLGMPGCWLLVGGLDVVLSQVTLSASQVTALPIPPGIAPGFQLFAQGAGMITPGSLPGGLNAFGAETSNGVASTIGTW